MSKIVVESPFTSVFDGATSDAAGKQYAEVAANRFAQVLGVSVTKLVLGTGSSATPLVDAKGNAVILNNQSEKFADIAVVHDRIMYLVQCTSRNSPWSRRQLSTELCKMGFNADGTDFADIAKYAERIKLQLKCERVVPAFVVKEPTIVGGKKALIPPVCYQSEPVDVLVLRLKASVAAPDVAAAATAAAAAASASVDEKDAIPHDPTSGEDTSTSSSESCEGALDLAARATARKKRENLLIVLATQVSAVLSLIDNDGMRTTVCEQLERLFKQAFEHDTQ